MTIQRYLQLSINIILLNIYLTLTLQLIIKLSIISLVSFTILFISTISIAIRLNAYVHNSLVALHSWSTTPGTANSFAWNRYHWCQNFLFFYNCYNKENAHLFPSWPFYFNFHQIFHSCVSSRSNIWTKI